MSTGIDLDALIGELEPHPLTYKGTTFDLPAELPGAALSPFLADELGLINLITEVMEAADAEAPTIDPETGLPVEEGIFDMVIRVLRARPALPKELLVACKASLSALLDDRAEEFFDLNPSVNAYFLIATHVGGLYGFDLSDFFGSPASSPAETDGGESSKATSSESTDSTPEASGDALVIPTSSEPAASSS
jgi:hypothetical protein